MYYKMHPLVHHTNKKGLFVMGYSKHNCTHILKQAQFKQSEQTSEAHSCNVPTTGMSMFFCGDLSSRPSIGIPPALRMASLFQVLLLQLQRARAPQRATSTSLCCSRLSDSPAGTQSNNSTCQKTTTAFQMVHWKVSTKREFVITVSTVTYIWVPQLLG